MRRNIGVIQALRQIRHLEWRQRSTGPVWRILTGWRPTGVVPISAQVTVLTSLCEVDRFNINPSIPTSPFCTNVVAECGRLCCYRFAHAPDTGHLKGHTCMGQIVRNIVVTCHAFALASLHFVSEVYSIQHLHTPPNPTCSRCYDHDWVKADYKPDSPPPPL